MGLEERTMNKSELFTKALILAAKKHAKQTRRDGTPYIYHPLKVAELVKEAGYDLSYQMAAVLHDTLEDTDTTEEELMEFGEEVLEAVKLLTRPEGADEEEYVQKILANPMAKTVKNADKISNMMDVVHCGDRSWGFYYVDKVTHYYKGRFSEELDQAIENARKNLIKK